MTDLPKPRQYWFAVKATFTCPSCDGESEEIMYVNASKPDPRPIAASIQRQNIKCRLCKKQPDDGAQINLNVLPVTLEQAIASGFKPPAGATD